MKPFPAKINSLRRLRSMGVEIGTIIDIGVHEQTPELIEVFPDLKHILIEPADDFYAKIRENYKNIDYELVEAAVSDFDGSSPLEKDNLGGGAVTHSKIMPTIPDPGAPSVRTIRLDSFLKMRSDQKPYLLKIDVDSVEAEILAGCADAWGDIDAIVLEVTHNSVFDRMSVLHNNNYVFFDLVDITYNYDTFYQADLIAVSSRVMEKFNMKPWRGQPHDWNKWVPTSLYESFIP